MKRWFGPRGFTMPVCEIDYRVGGSFRFILEGPNGHKMGMSGVYREINRPERLVYTQLIDGCDAQGSGEAMIEYGVHPWDLGALIPIVEEAGGKMTTWDGSNDLERPDVLASNGILHAEVLQMIRK